LPRLRAAIACCTAVLPQSASVLGGETGRTAPPDGIFQMARTVHDAHSDVVRLGRRRGTRMDALYLGLTIGFFALSWAFIVACDRLG